MIVLEAPKSSNYKRKRRDSHNIEMSIYVAHRHGNENDVERMLINEETLDMSASDESDMLKIDLTTRVALHLDDMRHHLEEAITLDIELLSVGEDHALHLTRQPKLLIMTSNESHRNKRQQVGLGPNNNHYCFENPRESRCCIRALNVEFAKIGWRWVIHPKTLAVNYCEGDCPYSWGTIDYETSNFPLILDHYRVLNPMGAPEPCCTGTMDGSVLVTLENAKIKVKYVPDIKVKSCRCG